MGRRKNANKARAQNIQAYHAEKSIQQSLLSFIPSEDKNSWQTLPDLSEITDSDTDNDSELEEVNKVIASAGSLDHLGDLTRRMVLAQKALHAAEQERRGNRPRVYLKNSKRTKQRHALNWKILKESGQGMISDIFRSFRSQDEGDVDVESDEDEMTDREDQEAMDNSSQEGGGLNGDVGFERDGLDLDGEGSNELETTFLEIEDSELEGDVTQPIDVIEHFLKLRNGFIPEDPTLPVASDHVLDQMNYTNFPRLREARESLKLKSKDKNIDVIFRVRLLGMVGTLNLYLDGELSYTWRQASIITAKSQQRGPHYARNLRTWIHQFLASGKLPFHRYGKFHTSILNDEDISQMIQLHLQRITKAGYIQAQDVVDCVEGPEVQARLQDLGSQQKTISVRTAQRWLHSHGWRYSRKANGMYVDGHERPDVVAYREAFVKCWETYEKRFVTYAYKAEKLPGGDEVEVEIVQDPVGFQVPAGQRFRLILVTHDESTFYENDRR